ncbi:hypothetical protein CJU90_2725 [Yarrowia sp. C11]|nr:hypothetical protein CKK34_4173 [Yarrowia sp. E02]KAG5369270.1 hypothetical protein CJU90_2725 [Yarrowia sp. C11]
MERTLGQQKIPKKNTLSAMSTPHSPQLPATQAWNVSGSETPAFQNRHKTSGQIFLQNWLQTQAEVDTPQRCNEHIPWNNQLSPGNPPRPIRRLSYPSLTPPGASYSLDSSVPSTSSNSIEIARRNLSSQIPGDFEADLSGELGDDVPDFNDFSCIAQALKDNTFSGLSSFDSKDRYFDESEQINFGNLPFLSATHAQLDSDLKDRVRGGRSGHIVSVDNDNSVLDEYNDAYSDPDSRNDGSFGGYSCGSNGPTPVTTFPRDTHLEPGSGAHNTTDMALEMLSIIASLDTITINKLHRLFSIAGQGDMTLAVERLQKHVRPRNDLPSLFAGSALQSVYSQPVETVMVTDTTPLLATAPLSATLKDDSKHSTWQRVKRRVSHSFKI